jgi:dienelactone hydrolase
MTLDTSPRHVRIDVAPLRPALDTELHIRMSGLPAGIPVALRAEATDPRGQSWRSAAVFAAAADGTLDLGRDAPVSGSYSGIDSMGLIWSMRRGGESKPGHVPDFLAPTPLRLVAEADALLADPGQLARVEVQRLRVPDGLVREDVRESGLVGTLYRPEGGDRLPGVVLLGGAEGGMHEDDAALLAAHGFAVMALAYYGMPGLPPTLRDIPLEYFATGLDQLRQHRCVWPGRLALVGVSKGGEAALATGSMLSGSALAGLRAVVSVVGSGLVTQGISQDVLGGSLLEILTTPVASWTYQGREVPYLRNVVTPALRSALADGAPVALRWAMPDLGRTALDPAAIIPVERIQGAVLLVSGEDDQGYGAAHHYVAEQRLAAASRERTWRHVVHSGAGHLIAAPPYAPTTQTTSPGPGVTFDHGGTAAADARARVATWQEIRRFLAQEL